MLNHGGEETRRDMEKEMRESNLTEQIIGGAIEVHRHWGPGLYEEIYERSLYHELKLRNMEFKSQLKLPLIYKGERVGDDLRLDLIVQDKVVVELKAVRSLEPVHDAQLITYMKLTQCKVGLLINFNVPVLTQGVKRMVL
jgi:GxxExxY protein